MSSSNAMSKVAILLRMVALLGCAAAPTAHAVQPIAGREDSNQQTTSGPGETARGQGEVDYEHAQPMPLPTIPDPAPAQNWPEAPITTQTRGHAEGSPGGAGAGEKNPRVLVPPRPSSR